MTKAKTTKLDKEIKEALFDPKTSGYKQFEAARIKSYTKSYGSVAKAKSAIRKAYLACKRKERDAAARLNDLKKSHVYSVYISTYSNKGWSEYHREGAAQTKEYAKKYAEYKKNHSNRPLRYNIIKETYRYQQPLEEYYIGNGKEDTDDEFNYDLKSSVPPQKWYEAMVRGIKKSSDVRNPYAIVKSIWAKLSPSGKAKIKAREKKGEHFKYNLPLPVDKPTKGVGTVRMVKPFKLAEVQVNLSVRDYLTALQSGIFSKMKRDDGTTALVARCKSPEKNVNVFIDKAGK